MAEKNKIRKQVVELQVGQGAASFAAQQEAAAWCRESLLPALEKVLEKYAGVGPVLQLDSVKVEIKLPQLDFGSSLAREIAGIVEKEVAVQLALQIKSSASSAVKKEHRFFETLLFFLRHGYLPWWTEIRSLRDFQDTWLQFSKTTKVIPDKEKFRAVLKMPGAAERLLSLQPESFFFSAFVTELLPLETVTAYFRAIEELGAVLPDDESLRLLARMVKKMLLQKEIQQEPYSLQEAIIKTTVQVLVRQFHVPPDVIQKRAGEQLPPDLIELTTEPTDGKQAIRIKEKAMTDETIFREEPDRVKVATVEREKEEGIYINNAGLVVVAPFLPLFFRNVGIAGEEEVNSINLAVALLQWMTTGREDYAEFETVLPKILCGIEPEENIDIVSKIPDLFKSEALELLLSVITHWTILKNTSVEGLQESFLQREGKLSFQNNQWLLQVEQKAYDMLLQHLPWNISMIKLPWMKYLLKTEWM